MTNVRAIFQNIMNEIQFQFDVFPPGGEWSYQPLPWINLNRVKRGQGTKSRFEAIEASLAGLSISSGMDIGCHVGYFCFAMAQKGIPMLGIDVDPRSIRIAQYVANKIGIQNIVFCPMAVSTATMCLLPKVDIVLLLSVWHHWVREHGFETAGQMLSAVWERSGKVLFFESGETEMTPEFGLSAMGNSPKEWLTNYLGNSCADSEIIHLGQFKAFAPSGNENRNVVYRNLFQVVRKTKASQ